MSKEHLQSSIMEAFKYSAAVLFCFNNSRFYGTTKDVFQGIELSLGNNNIRAGKMLQKYV